MSEQKTVTYDFVVGKVKKYITVKWYRHEALHSTHLLIETVRSCGCILKLPQHYYAFNSDRLDAVCKESYSLYKKGALNRNLSFNLTFEELKNLITQPCHYCGELRGRKTRFSYDQNVVAVIGIDRKDNNIGYQLDNCLPCCKTCNFMKKNYSFEEFLLNCNAVSENHAENIRKIKSKLLSESN